MNDYFLIIDGSSLLASSYFGILPPQLKNPKLSEEEAKKFYPRIMHTTDGKYTNAIFGFTKTLLNILTTQNPKYIVVNWDEHRNTTFRKKLYPDYKGTRKPTPEPLREQKETIMKMLAFIGIQQFKSPEFEADDFAGTLAKKYEDETYIRILTKDRDHLQLVDDKTNVWLTFTVDKEGFSTQVDELNAKFNIDASSLEIPNNVFEVTKDLVKPFYGVEASGVVDLKALMGDTADNIPGVKGIGEKTANILVDKFKTIENLYGYIEGNNEEDVCAYFKECGIKSSKKVYSVLTAKDNNGIAGKEAALLSKQLATIKTDINLGELPLEVFETKINEDNLITSLKRLQFNSLLNYYNN